MLEQVEEENGVLREELELQRSVSSMLERLKTDADKAKAALADECKQLHKVTVTDFLT